jgi:hypothetical protein
MRDVQGMGSSVDGLTGRSRLDVLTCSDIRAWLAVRVRHGIPLLHASARLYSSCALSESWAQSPVVAGMPLLRWLAAVARRAGSWRPDGPIVPRLPVGWAVVAEH